MAIYISSEAHGGDCCGMFHLFAFPMSLAANALSLDDKIALIRRTVDLQAKGEDYDEEDEDCSTPTHTSPFCVEVVLSAHQHLAWREALEACGFKAVHTFTNGNTSNELTVFLGDF